MPPAISLVTPVFNGAKYLRETIDSVLAQTDGDFEYLIMDGASTDGSAEIARDYAARDSRIQVASEPDRGMYDALLKGLERTRGDLLGYLNADDKLLPGAFAALRLYRGVLGSEWMTGIPAFWDAEGRLFRVGFPRWYGRQFLRRGLYHGAALGWVQQESTFFSRRLWDAVPASRRELIRGLRLAGDFVLWATLAEQSSLTPIPTVLGGFRMHATNASHTQAAAYLEEIRACGFWVPSAGLGRVLRGATGPLSFALAVRAARRAERKVRAAR